MLREKIIGEQKANIKGSLGKARRLEGEDVETG
jgi:hypothetical protein